MYEHAVRLIFFNNWKGSFFLTFCVLLGIFAQEESVSALEPHKQTVR